MTETTTPKQSLAKKKRPIHTRPLKLWQDHSHNQEVRIEIVPLIDVIFCILTFFILGAVGLSRTQAISLDLPKASSGVPQMREMLVVSLDEIGQVYVEKQPVTMNQLYATLKQYHQFNPNGVMVLHAPRNATYNDVIQVLDLLRQVGGDRVSLATLPGASGTPESLKSNPGLNSLPPGSGLPIPGGYPNQMPGNYPPNPSLPNVPPAPSYPR